MEISAQMVKDLREMTGAGMMDCKTALAEAAGNVEQAVEILRKKGLSRAAKRAGSGGSRDLPCHGWGGSGRDRGTREDGPFGSTSCLASLHPGAIPALHGSIAPRTHRPHVSPLPTLPRPQV